MLMKRTLFFLSLLASVTAAAQNEESSLALDEITIQGSRVITKVDGQTIYPSAAQKNASSNGYHLLQRLSLPNLRVDNVAHTITALDARGLVQLRINGILASKQEMLALKPEAIRKIDFIDNPGVRYGDDVAYVINIITRREDNGYTLLLDATPTLTSSNGSGMAFGKYIHKKSALSVSYDYNGCRLKGNGMNEVADYTLNNDDIYTIERNSVSSLYQQQEHDIKLTYNLADSTAQVFQVSLSESHGVTPKNISVREIHENASSSLATKKQTGKHNSPVLDLYFFRQLTPKQSVTANAVGTYQQTDYSYYYDEVKPYQYCVNGQTASALSEINYEYRLKPFTLSAGINHYYKYVRNRYEGDSDTLSVMRQNNLYAFCNIKGVYKAFHYAVGLGASRLHYTQNDHTYNLWAYRPKATFSYRIMRGLQISYNFGMKPRGSRIAMTSDAVIQTNSMEYTIGNPNLKPSRDTNHELRITYNNIRWSAYVNGLFRHCHKPNMAFYERTDDNKFLYTQINQKAINLLQLSAYASYWIVPEKLQASAYGGMQRCFNYGFSYTHLYTSWFYVTQLTAYLGRFTLQAYLDNGNRFLEGESKGYSGSYAGLQASFRHKDWQFALTWSNPFTNNYKAAESELINNQIYKHSVNINRDSGNSVTINISWRLTRGKKHNSPEKKIHLQDKNDGILK